MDKPVSRRAWFAALATGTGAVAAACGPAGPSEINTPEGKVLQWEGNDILVLVSGIQPSYQIGDTIHLNLLVNNQSTQVIEVKLRPKVLGLGDQPVIQSDQPAQLTVNPEDAANVNQDLPIGRNLGPGDYTLAVEVPPWKVGGRDTGGGATLRTSVQLLAAS